MIQFKQLIFTIMVATLILPACSTTKVKTGSADSAGRVKYDRFEGFNRAIFKFNLKVDRYFMKPVAKGYRKVVPKFARTGVANFFKNLREPITTVNSLFQGKGKRFLRSLGRFLINSTIGIYGLFDVAKHMGLKRHTEDFGQTLAVWGVKSGPYLVLPLFGPSSIRDSNGLIVDYYLYPPNYMEEKSTRDKMFLLELIVIRESLLIASEIMEEATSDQYIFVREAYRQQRRYEIYDGKPPEEKGPDDSFLFGDGDDSKEKEKDRPADKSAPEPKDKGDRDKAPSAETAVE